MFVPGDAAVRVVHARDRRSTPNMKSKPYVPLGVRPSPSRFSPAGATPLRPTYADHGPNTCVQPFAPRSYAVTRRVARAVAARRDRDHLLRDADARELRDEQRRGRGGGRRWRWRGRRRCRRSGRGGRDRRGRRGRRGASWVRPCGRGAARPSWSSARRRSSWSTARACRAELLAAAGRDERETEHERVRRDREFASDRTRPILRKRATKPRRVRCTRWWCVIVSAARCSSSSSTSTTTTTLQRRRPTTSTSTATSPLDDDDHDRAGRVAADRHRAARPHPDRDDARRRRDARVHRHRARR